MFDKINCCDCDEREIPSHNSSFVVGLAMLESIDESKGCSNWKTCKKRMIKNV